MGVKKLDLQPEKAVLEVQGVGWDLPLVWGTEGEKSIDISQLRAQTGFITLDPAYMNTGATTSQITYLDGENGVLRYRGYPIEELAQSCQFLEVAYLLIQGELPKKEELAAFMEEIQAWSKVSSDQENGIKAIPKSTHPMAALGVSLLMLSGENPGLCHQDLSQKEKTQAMAQLLAQTKNLAAAFYRHRSGLAFIPSDPKKSYCSDLYHMMFGVAPSPEVEKALNVLLILHADHEQNCSTSTVRLVGSSKANLFATISAAVMALWGPLHGGANEEVILMLEEIQKAGGDYKKFLDRAKDKNDPFKLMGFGHRVYKNFDPRAQIIKKSADAVLGSVHKKDPLLDIARGLEEAALKDPYFVDRKLYPNVDFYSGIIYRALGIPSQMFTVMFALGRLPGWLAHWKEMTDSPQTKIGRPRQIYTGPEKRSLKK
jgi:citrate synthase